MRMKIIVEAFKSKFDMNSSSNLCQMFEMETDAPYQSPAVGEQFKKDFLDKARDEISKNLCGDASSQETRPVNIACDAKEWDCKQRSFTVKMVFPGRHSILGARNGTVVVQSDYSKPDAIYYLKGTIIMTTTTSTAVSQSLVKKGSEQ